MCSPRMSMIISQLCGPMVVRRGARAARRRKTTARYRGAVFALQALADEWSRGSRGQMRKVMKLLHTLASCGLIGGLLASIVLLLGQRGSTPAADAIALSFVSRYLI